MRDRIVKLFTPGQQLHNSLLCCLIGIVLFINFLEVPLDFKQAHQGLNRLQAFMQLQVEHLVFDNFTQAFLQNIFKRNLFDFLICLIL